jgi:hypothetical protein
LKKKKKRRAHKKMDANATAEEIQELFTSLLHREPRDEELIYHRDKPLFQKRNEFLNCSEFKSQRVAKKVAVLLCGQLRNIEFCIDSLLEHLIQPNQESTEFHFFIATQDCVSIKPRLSAGLINQYFVYPIDANSSCQLYQKKVNVCNIHVRECYQTVLANQLPNMQLKMVGWTETFLDLKLAIEMAFAYETKNNVKYDLFIRTRPDFLYSKPCICYQLPTSTCAKSFSDCFFIMDRECSRKLCGFYDYYSTLLTQAKMQEFQKLGTWDPSFICEVQLDQFLAMHKINIIHQDIQDQGMPLSWLVAHVKNQQPIPLSEHWQQKLMEFVNQLVPCTFDVPLSIA